MSQPVSRLVHGDVVAYLAGAPISYGGSALLRAPLFVLAHVLGGGEVAAYRAGSALGVVALAALAWLLTSMLAERRSLACVLAVVVCVANPVAIRALEMGHAEEPLTAVLCIFALLLALRGRSVAATVTLGVAIASKQWAVLALGPVLLASDGRRLRMGLGVAAVAGGVLLPFYLANPGGSTALTVSNTGALMHPLQAWWPLGVEGATPGQRPGMLQRFEVQSPAWLAATAHPLIVIVGAAIAGLWGRLKGRPRADALLLLALVLLVRCLLDPWNTQYYMLPTVLALASWEVQRGRAPVIATVLSAATWVTFSRLALTGDDALGFAVYMAWAAPLVAWMAFTLLRRERLCYSTL